MRWLISIEEEPYHDSKLFTQSLNDNWAKSRVIKITLVCVDVIYSHFRISVNCLNHFYWVSLAQMEIGLKHVLVIPSSLTLAGFAKFSAPRTKLEKQNIRLTAEITDYLCLFFDFRGIRWPLAFPGHVRRYILQYINEITVLLILHGY